MKKSEVIENKVYGLVLVALGVVSSLVNGDATFLVVASVFGIPMFFCNMKRRSKHVKVVKKTTLSA